MSKDIRSYFSVLSTKPASKINKSLTSTKKRKQAVIISSDEDVIPNTPIQEKKKVLKKRKQFDLSSDCEEEPKKLKENSTKSKETLQPVKAADVFGSEPVKQAKLANCSKAVNVSDKIEPSKKKGKKKKELETEKFTDKVFEQTLLDLDDDFLSENMDQLDQSIKVAEIERCQDTTLETEMRTSETLKSSTEKIAKITETNIERSVNKEGEKTDKKMKEMKETKDETLSLKRKSDIYDPEQDMNRYEKKRRSAVLYQKYLNRSGPIHHGTKDIPKGKPDCLNSLCFIRTGVLDSLDNEEFESVIKNHGGRIVHSVSKKVNYVVAGDDPGPAKIEKAKSYGITIISEDEVLNLIRKKSGMEIKSYEEDQSLDNLISGLEDKKSDNQVKSISSIKENGTSGSIKNSRSDNKKSPKMQTDQVNGHTKDKNTELVVSKYFNNKKSEKDNSSKSSNAKMFSVHPKQTTLSTDKTLEFLPWTEKYKPTNVKSVIGQQGDKSALKRLTVWLENWFKNHSGKNKPKLVKPNPWAKNDDGSYFKAALLSGPPGVGKTTTAHLVSKELGYDVVEFNASDTRSKRLLQEELSQLLTSKSLAGFLTGGASPTKKHILLMDEVDGMAGNEDRGGMQELIALIKNSSIPIICMCNDRNHPKIRSLVNYCFDLRFTRPRIEQIKGAMMSVCFKEGIDITPNALNEVINAAGMDIRQILTNLCVWSAGKNALHLDTTTKDALNATKDVPLGQWEVCHKVFSEEENKKMSINDRARLFYHDYSLAPLFVHENYLKVIPHASKKEFLKRFSTAADSISMGDIIDKQIRSSNNWALLDAQAMCASVIPGSYLRGHLNGQIDFPGWLGKNSKKNKFNRLVSEIQAHMRTSISGSRSAVNLDYVTHLRNNIAKPLINEGLAGVGEALRVMQSYNLLREDLDAIIELSQWPKQKDPMNMVDSKVKAAFTRAYNKGTVLPYSVQSAGLKKKGSTNKSIELDIDNYGELEEEADSSPEDADDICNDAMIKTKKPSGSKNKVAESKPHKLFKAESGKGRKKK